MKCPLKAVTQSEQYNNPKTLISFPIHTLTGHVVLLFRFFSGSPKMPAVKSHACMQTI